MQGNQTILDVGSGSHFCRGAEQDTHLTGAHFSEKLLLSHIRIGIVDEGDLFGRHTAVDELLSNIVVNCKCGIRVFFHGNGILQCLNLRAVQHTG